MLRDTRWGTQNWTRMELFQNEKQRVSLPRMHATLFSEALGRSSFIKLQCQPGSVYLHTDTPNTTLCMQINIQPFFNGVMHLKAVQWLRLRRSRFNSIIPQGTQSCWLRWAVETSLRSVPAAWVGLCRLLWSPRYDPEHLSKKGTLLVIGHH